MDNLKPKVSDFELNKYVNKHNVTKFQIVLNEDYLNKLINGDDDLITYINNKYRELKPN